MFVVPGYVSKEFDFINANFHSSTCLAELRKQVMGGLPISKYDRFLMACKDSVTGAWTEWSPLIYNFPFALDVHRSILACEIIVESDFECYEDNVLAVQRIGGVLEGKGWIPHYFFSGSKSVHVHLFLDFNTAFTSCNQQLLKTATSYFVNEKRFVKEFMEFLRGQVLQGGVLNLNFFDKQLVKCSHLIRMQLSKNKKGFKTFMGNECKDLSFVMPLKDWSNGLFPVPCTEFSLSVPTDFNSLLSKFVRLVCAKKKKRKLECKQLGLLGFNSGSVKPCVQKVLDGEFVDGRKRLMFVLVNELKKGKGRDEVELLVKNWCQINDLKFVQSQFDVTFGSDEYKLNCGYLSKLFLELDLGFCGECKFNVGG